MAGERPRFDRRDGIHVFEDKAFKRWIAMASVAVLVLGALVGAFAALAGGSLVEALDDVFGSIPLFLLLAVMITSFLVHELVHGLFFKLFAPAGAKVTFGANWKAGMLYACAEGIVYPRTQYLVIIMAPTVVVTALLLAGGALTGHLVAGYLLAVVHLSGCTGDWGYALELARDSSIARCEDTAWGVRFLRDSEAEDLRSGGSGEAAL